MKKRSIKAYSFEFLLIFVAVISAFALNTWNDNRKSKLAEQKILGEIYEGLYKDSLDLEVNRKGHLTSIEATRYFNDIIDQKEVNKDSLLLYYLFLTRDVISVQNTSGYEALKSKGLEIIENDSLRTALLSLYEFDFQKMKKFAEQYPENQYYTNYFHGINKAFSNYFIYDSVRNLKSIKTPISFEKKEKQLLRSYLWEIKVNRKLRVKACSRLNVKIGNLRQQIEAELL